MNSREHKTWIEISASALVHNLDVLKKITGNHVLLAPALKANAYGHGLPQVLSIVEKDPSIQYIGLDSVYEASEARALGYERGIIILGYTPHATLQNVVELHCDQVIYDLETAEKLNNIARTTNTKARVHIKIETGTARQGVSLHELEYFLQRLRTYEHLDVVGTSTHFAASEDPSDPMTSEQHARFTKALDLIHQANYFPTLVHAACSAAVIDRLDTHHTLVRPGIALYGLYPSEQLRSKMLSADIPGVLVPVLTWKTIVAQIKEVPASTPIGYSHTQVVSRNTRLAVIPVGYADGLDRGLSSQGYVLIRGKRANILGRICMNMCMVDITDIPDTELEDEVVLIGKQGSDEIGADTLASMAQTIHYEVIARLNPKIPRVVV
jgi:alanine racemase